MSVRAFKLLVLSAACPLALGLAASCRADETSSFALSSDTPAYCAQLARQVADRHSPLSEVQHLLAEGREMCERGQVRGGIRRLRRALVMLHHHVVLEDKGR